MAAGIANPAEHWESVARSNFKRIEQLEKEKLKRGKLLERIGSALGISYPLENRESIIPEINKLKKRNKEFQVEIDIRIKESNRFDILDL